MIELFVKRYSEEFDELVILSPQGTQTYRIDGANHKAYLAYDMMVAAADLLRHVDEGTQERLIALYNNC